MGVGDGLSGQYNLRVDALKSAPVAQQMPLSAVFGWVVLYTETPYSDDVEPLIHTCIGSSQSNVFFFLISSPDFVSPPHLASFCCAHRTNNRRQCRASKNASGDL